ncbi:MAG: dipeptidase [Pseudomonadota bacterium]
MKKTFLGLILLLAVIVAALRLVPGVLEASMNQVLVHDAYPVSDADREFHNSLIVADLHADSTLWNRDLRSRGGRGHVDLPRLREGNVAIQSFTFVTKTPAGMNYETNDSDARDNITLLALVQAWPFATWASLTERALFQAQKLTAIAEYHPQELRILRSAKDVQALLSARAEGAKTVGALLGVEGAHALDGSLANVDRLHSAGVRMMGLHHFFDNAVGGSLHGTGSEGLSDFGRQVVQRMDELRMIIDLAHSSEQSVRDVLAQTDRPLIVSHTGFQGHCPTPRNISDNLMQALAARGSLIGVGFWDAAVCKVSPEGIAEAIEYGIELVGVEHVALGSDYDGSTTVAFDVSELAVLTAALRARGIADADIAKVMGGNQARFLRENL